MLLCDYEVDFCDMDRDIIVSRDDVIKITIMSPLNREKGEYIGKFIGALHIFDEDLVQLRDERGVYHLIPSEFVYNVEFVEDDKDEPS